MPEWRQQLEALGVGTGNLVAIQSRQAAETFLLFVIMLFTGLWMAGHRPSPSQLRRWALTFTLGVASYAIFSKIMQNLHPGGLTGQDANFGFFPNRNHTATYLAMGSICGLGCVLQALRDKRFAIMTIALAATGTCLLAITAWSVTRGGVVLVAVGCVAWLPMLGRRYLGKHGLWAVGLMGLAMLGLFLIADTAVKSRLTSTVEKVGSAINPGAGVEKTAMDAYGDLDFRIPTALDTFDLIRDYKWTGIGPGQYYYIFPQYKKRTIIANDADSFHPESDWLWMAAEAGVPATVALLLLVALAIRKSLMEILGGRDRALRGACLTAAMLVPIHGLFDVPGHRITLAWSAALLFTLSLQRPSADSSPRLPGAWPSRILAFVLIAGSIVLIRAQWWGGAQPALTTSSRALAEARLLVDKDQVLQREAAKKGQSYQPDPTEDLLEQALVLLDHAVPSAPLDRDLYRYRAFLAFQFDDKYELIEHDFAIDRSLDPTWVAGPMRQGEAWAAIRPQYTGELWREALRRAENLDQLQPENQWSKKLTLKRIREFAHGKPELEALVPASN